MTTLLTFFLLLAPQAVTLEKSLHLTSPGGERTYVLQQVRDGKFGRQRISFQFGDVNGHSFGFEVERIYQHDGMTYCEGRTRIHGKPMRAWFRFDGKRVTVHPYEGELNILEEPIQPIRAMP